MWCKQNENLADFPDEKEKNGVRQKLTEDEGSVGARETAAARSGNDMEVVVGGGGVSATRLLTLKSCRTRVEELAGELRGRA